MINCDDSDDAMTIVESKIPLVSVPQDIILNSVTVTSSVKLCMCVVDENVFFHLLDLLYCIHENSLKAMKTYSIYISDAFF